MHTVTSQDCPSVIWVAPFWELYFARLQTGYTFISKPHTTKKSKSISEAIHLLRRGSKGIQWNLLAARTSLTYITGWVVKKSYSVKLKSNGLSTNEILITRLKHSFVVALSLETATLHLYKFICFTEQVAAEGL